MASPLICASELADRLNGGPVSVLDVRWDLAQGARRDLFAAGHIPGAVFVDLPAQLAGTPAPDGSGGRHPLPAPAEFVAGMRIAGVCDDRSVVVYDGSGALAAARAWWLLRYYGHCGVTVLDGGLDAWRAGGRPLAVGGGDTPQRGDFSGRPGQMPVLGPDDAAMLARRGGLLDARTAERFRGEVEPVDPVAGHIPGARNRPTTANLGPDGRFLTAAELRSAFAGAGAAEGAAIGVYCGSGVTAAHQVLALELAGLAAALYPGSWSDWVSDPARPVATGPV